MSTDTKLQRILELMAADDSADAPAESVKWAKNLFRTRSVEQPSLLKRIVAVLTADLSGGAPAFGERSASAAKARQMLFTAGEYAIDVRVMQTKKKFELRGQVIGKDVVGGTVKLEATNLSSELGKGGEFRLPNVAAGKYDLVVTLSDAELVAANIELR